jgi:histidinol dehydrogenase
MIKILNWSQAPQKEKEKIMQRAQADMEAIKEYVAQWIDKIKTQGDKAIIEYVQKFDNKDFIIEKLRISKEDIDKAYKNIDPKVLKAIQEQIRISKAFHEKQVESIERLWQTETIEGVITGVKKVPIEAVGLYVPAGKAPLPTVAQILTVAAAAAGVPRKVVCFPPTGEHYEIIVAANEAGADEIYRVGGIAAIAALAFGTEMIKPVYKIVGPGNPYVQAAKLQVFGQVGIDMLSGPSEALIMADESSDPRYLAADILARCEHGADSAGVVVTYSKEIAKQTKQEIEKQAPKLLRQEFIQKALDNYSAIIIVENEEEMIKFTNEYSAEHLGIQVKDPKKIFSQIKNAGSVFLGNYAPVAVGDYASGTNHCLPTGATPKFSSPIGVETFMKNVEFQELTAEGLKKLQPIVQTISRVEGLDAHENSVNIRFE